MVACLEATGVYGENLCQFLHDMGAKVYLMNPSQIKYYAKSIMKRAKTDQVDAQIIMQYIKLHADKLKPWQPRSKEYNQLKSIFRCLKTFKENRVRTQGYMEACSSTDRSGQSDALKAYKSLLKSIDLQIEELENKLLTIVEKCDELKTHYTNLQTIPGVGKLTAIGILGEVPDISLFSHVKQLVAYAGLNPSIKQSGSSVYGAGRISKMGSKDLRNVLYMPSLVGKNRCKAYKPLVDRLNEKKKKAKLIVIAVMHKILRIVFAILKKGVPFDEAALTS
ncbi:MAG: IS110 family transposase ISWen2 [Holosporales bacterium]